jgi:hypothetical protein
VPLLARSAGGEFTHFKPFEPAAAGTLYAYQFTPGQVSPARDEPGCVLHHLDNGQMRACHFLCHRGRHAGSVPLPVTWRQWWSVKVEM